MQILLILNTYTYTEIFAFYKFEDKKYFISNVLGYAFLS